MGKFRFVHFDSPIEGSGFYLDPEKIVAIGSHRDPEQCYIWTGPREDDCFTVKCSPAQAASKIEALRNAHKE